MFFIACTYSIGFALLVIPFVLCHAHCTLSGHKLAMMARIIMTSAIYQKVTLVYRIIYDIVHFAITMKC